MTFEQDLHQSVHQRATYSLSSSQQASTNLIADPPYTPAYGGSVSDFEWSDFTFDSHTSLKRHYASYQADWHVSNRGRAGDHRITALADWNGERATLDDRLNAGTSTASRDNVGAAVQHQMLWRRHPRPPARGWKTTTASTQRSFLAGRRSSLRQNAGGLGDARHAAAGLGSRSRPFFRASHVPVFTGNADLEPERSRTAGFGVEQRSPRIRQVDATWFDNSYRDIIGLRSTGSFTSGINIDYQGARRRTLRELAPRQTLRIRSGYTSSTRNGSTSEQPGVCRRTARFRRPRHSGFVQVVVVAAHHGGPHGHRSATSTAFLVVPPPIVGEANHVGHAARLSARVEDAGVLAIGNLTSLDYQEPLDQALQRAVRARSASVSEDEPAVPRQRPFVRLWTRRPAASVRACRRHRGGTIVRPPRAERIWQDDAAAADTGVLTRPAEACCSTVKAVKICAVISPAASCRAAETRATFDFTVLEMVLMGRYQPLGPFELEGAADLEIARPLLRPGTAALEGRRFTP